jgi:hypothetical protein
MKLGALLSIGLVVAMIPLAEGGVAVGERAPEFTLRDANGEVHALADLLGDEILALLFFRSADW